LPAPKPDYLFEVQNSPQLGPILERVKQDALERYKSDPLLARTKFRDDVADALSGDILNAYASQVQGFAGSIRVDSLESFEAGIDALIAYVTDK
jgi:hypothetical protein